MNVNRITVRYAKAYFALAKEQNILEEVAADAKLIFDTLQDNSELTNALNNVVLPSSKKSALLREIFDNHIGSVSRSFMNLIIKNRREAYMKDVLRNFLVMYRRTKGIIDGEITTAVPVTASTVSAINDKIEQVFQTRVELKNRVKPEIIGGFLLRFDDKQLDASIARELKTIKHNLEQAGEH